MFDRVVTCNHKLPLRVMWIAPSHDARTWRVGCGADKLANDVRRMQSSRLKLNDAGEGCIIVCGVFTIICAGPQKNNERGRWSSGARETNVLRSFGRFRKTF